MKHLVYDKNTGKILMSVRCRRETAILQEKNDRGVLLDVNTDISNFTSYKVVDGEVVYIEE